MDSILTSIKKVLGIDEAYEHFDADIMMHINSVFFTLYQLGVGPDKPFVITNKDSVWSDFITDKDIEMIKSYIYLKVKIVFDPPTSSFVLDAYKNQIAEYEWRMNVEVDPTE